MVRCTDGDMARHEGDVSNPADITVIDGTGPRSGTGSTVIAFSRCYALTDTHLV